MTNLSLMMAYDVTHDFELFNRWVAYPVYLSTSELFAIDEYLEPPLKSGRYHITHKDEWKHIPTPTPT